MVKFQLAGGRPAGYLQTWPRSCSRGYREQHQLAATKGLDPEISGCKVRHQNHSATLPSPSD